MSLPDTVTEHLDGEESVAEVALGGDDRLVVTPTRSLVYRAEGLLSDETVEEFAHDAERITLSTSRRKAKLTLDYGLDGEQTLTIPKGKLDDVLHPLLAGVLDAQGITDAGETVKRTFRFSELTLIVTSKRVVKHIGQAVWDEEHEEYAFENVTDLDFEPGNVATSVVLTHDGRQERFKAPNDEARAVEAAITDALLSAHDVRDIDELREQTADEEATEAETETEEDSPFGEGPELFGREESEETDVAEEPEPAEKSESIDESASNGTDRIIEQVTEETEPPTEEPTPTGTAADESESPEVGDIAADVEELRTLVESQQEQLDRQNELIEQLIEELRQGR